MDSFGFKVQLSDDGTILAAGAREYMGYSHAPSGTDSSLGTRIMFFSDNYRGYARVYNIDDTNDWGSTYLVKRGTANHAYFGARVAVSGDGARACIGAYGEMDAMWRSGLLLYLTAPYSVLF